MTVQTMFRATWMLFAIFVVVVATSVHATEWHGSNNNDMAAPPLLLRQETKLFVPDNNETVVIVPAAAGDGWKNTFVWNARPKTTRQTTTTIQQERQDGVDKPLSLSSSSRLGLLRGGVATTRQPPLQNDNDNDRARKRRDLRFIKKTDIVLRNNCRQIIDRLMVYYYWKKDEEWKTKEIGPLLPGSTVVAARTIESHFYLHATSLDFVWADDESTVCLEGEEEKELCLYLVRMEDHSPIFAHGNPARQDFVFTLQCDSPIAGKTTTRRHDNVPAATTPQSSSMSLREMEFLQAHNRRRRIFHETHGKSYVPLQWSPSMATHARDYAAFLRDNFACHIGRGLDPAHPWTGGENIAAVWTHNETQVPSVEDQLLFHWADMANPERQRDDENADPAFGTFHFPFAQVMWRSTRFLGCGEVSFPQSIGGACHIHVCRYLRPGNCAPPDQYPLQWKDYILADDTPCPPYCPQEGCFY